MPYEGDGPDVSPPSSLLKPVHIHTHELQWWSSNVCYKTWFPYQSRPTRFDDVWGQPLPDPSLLLNLLTCMAHSHTCVTMLELHVCYKTWFPYQTRPTCFDGAVQRGRGQHLPYPSLLSNLLTCMAHHTHELQCWSYMFVTKRGSLTSHARHAATMQSRGGGGNLFHIHPTTRP